MAIRARYLKTSALLHTAASWLDGVAMRPSTKVRDRAELLAIASELRVRARWLEVGREDQAISAERRAGIAQIEDVDQGRGNA